MPGCRREPSQRRASRGCPVAYVILPFSDTAPADAIRASLAPFQRGGRGDLPDAWLAFKDETEGCRRAHEARFVLTERATGGMEIDGDDEAYWYLDTLRARDEMQRRGLRRWSVRFAIHLAGSGRAPPSI